VNGLGVVVVGKKGGREGGAVEVDVSFSKHALRSFVLLLSSSLFLPSLSLFLSLPLYSTTLSVPPSC